VVVYQPGGTPTGNIYTTLAAACAAAAAVAPYGPIVEIDNSLGTPIGTSGFYNVDGFTFRARNLLTTLTLEDGATFAANKLTIDGLNIIWQHVTEPPWTANGTTVLYVQGFGAQLTAGGSASQPFLFLGSGTICALYLNNSGKLQGGAGAAVVSAASGVTAVDVYAFSDAAIAANSLTGAGGIDVFADVSSTMSATQTGASALQLIVATQLIVANVVAMNTSGQSIANNVAPAIVTGWTALTNTVALGGSFNETTGVFTTGVLGFYHVDAQVEFSAAAATLGAEFTIGFYRNGSLIKEFPYENPVASLSVKRALAVSGGVPCEQGDTIDIRVAQASGGTIALTTSSARNTLTIAFDAV
jgi:hypothetical protein